MQGDSQYHRHNVVFRQQLVIIPLNALGVKSSRNTFLSATLRLSNALWLEKLNLKLLRFVRSGLDKARVVS